MVNYDRAATTKQYVNVNSVINIVTIIYSQPWQPLLRNIFNVKIIGKNSIVSL